MKNDLSASDVKYFVVHCSATPPGRDIGAREIDEMHLARPDMRCRIGYHTVIRRNGAIEQGRPLNKVGAHSRGDNHHSWGVVLIGGVDDNGKAEDNFTSEQYSSLRMVIASWQVLAPQAETLGHRDLSPDANGDGVIDRRDWLKMCPCFDVRAWYRKTFSELGGKHGVA